MAFTVPNEAAATYAGQSLLDSTDLAILAAGHAGFVVVSGGAATVTGADRVVTFPASSVRHGDAAALQAVSAGSVTIAAAHASLDRRDLVVVTTAGALAIRAGTPAVEPVKAVLVAGDVARPEVYVRAGSTVVTAGDLVDKGVVRPPRLGETLAVTHLRPISPDPQLRSTTSTSWVAIDPALAVTFVAPPSGRVVVRLNLEIRVWHQATDGYWALGNALGAFMPGTDVFIAHRADAAPLVAMQKYVAIEAAGLTPGESVTIQWLFRSSGGLFEVAWSGDRGPARMEVQSA